MVQRGVMSDEVANRITTWDTDDEWLSDEEDSATQMSSFILSAARPSFIALDNKCFD